MCLCAGLNEGVCVFVCRFESVCVPEGIQDDEGQREAGQRQSVAHCVHDSEVGQDCHLVLLRRQADRQTDRQTGRQTGRQGGREGGRQTDRQTDRQTGTQGCRDAFRCG